MKEKGTNLCVGLDPYKDRMPDEFRANARGMRYFCQGVIGAVNSLVGVVKMQSAFFEAEGPPGMADLERAFQDARDFGLATILDYKRGDIPDTALYYAKAGFEYYKADAVTVQPWMGEACIKTFVDCAREKGAGVFVVGMPSSAENEPLGFLRHSSYFLSLMDFIFHLGVDNIKDGYADVGVVIGANHIQLLRQCRKEYPTIPFLVPGVGAQGGKAEELAGLSGVIVSASRSVLYPGGDGCWKENITAACKLMCEKLKGTSQ
jgi:orotidine-5'-phosphate decarboxylase